MTRAQLRRRAMCPDCGRVKLWAGEAFGGHRRAAAPTGPRPGPGLDIFGHQARQSTTCEGSGRPIEAQHLR